MGPEQLDISTQQLLLVRLEDDDEDVAFEALLEKRVHQDYDKAPT